MRRTIGRIFIALTLWTTAVPMLAAGRPDLLLITIDTLRADFVSANGAARVATPHLDRLAGQGANFTRARSPVPLTLPAHASILTAEYPPTHGVRSNGEYRLADGELSLAEVLERHGYDTAAFLGSFVLDRRFGLDQGFDLYDDRVWDDVEELETLEAERRGDEVAEAFAGWLAEIDDARPFFAWVHLYDPHAPYDAPEPFRSRYDGDPYAAEVAYADAVVGTILDELATRDRLDRTLVAVAGDHGEGLGEHGEQTHSLLIFNSTLHVPMMLWGPGVVRPAGSIPELVRLIDLAPTLLDYLGFDPSLGEGVSLRSLIEHPSAADREGTERTAYSESLYPELALGWSGLRGLESGEYRLIVGPQPRLFQVLVDRGETENLVASAPGAYQRLKGQLRQQLESMEAVPGAAARPELDAAAEEKLRSLGYLAGGGSQASRKGPPVDPMSRVALWNRIQQGIAEMGGGALEAAVSTFESVLREDPDMPLVYEYLGTCWQRLEKADEAAAVYRRALDRGLESARLHHEIGRISLARGETEAAERELQIALALDPQSVVAHYELANLYRARGRLAAAVEHYRRALAINPSYLWGWNGLAIALSGLGEAGAAADAFRRAVEIDPDGPLAHFNLAVALERQGADAEAVVHYRRFLELEAGTAGAGHREQAERAIARLTSPK